MINENEMKLEFLSKSNNEAFARITVAAFVASLDPTIEEISDIKTAVSEAVTNSIVHGYEDKIGIINAGIFAISLILYGYLLVSYSLESAPVFLVMMISSIILLKKIKKIKNLYLFIFIIACITNYVDYLTVPLITLAIPLILYITYKQKENSNLQYKYFIKIIIKSSIIWLLGYALTWFSKWVIYDILYN